ncbi:hypothetical protein Ahy_B09g098967 [Arachis hypogaea]|uniref:Aminotransferase-like plant mobile domain-containing protein n=1 Tax=Arachis hypogaea TaxID=3818 RepID=A0A444XSK1_ARAHY|nr:hypothetical protein Ahy_B09g098967 [Arachis hypogaea]
MGNDPERLYRLDGVAHIAGVINDEKFAVNCTWFQETFGECHQGADEETVRRYARAYIMMLLGTQLFANKFGNRIHIRWLPYVARLEETGGYSWASAALAWLYRCMYRVANKHVVKLAGPLQLLQSWIFWRFPGFRPVGYDTFSWPLVSRWSGHNPSASEKGPRPNILDVFLQFIWMPYSSPDVLQVVHPEVLEPRHTALWRCVTSLIYFAVIEWHQVDRVLLVQSCPQHALNIDFLMSKDGRGGDHWFPYSFQFWHLHWESRADHIFRFDVVADPGPSHDFLDWWRQHGKRFLSPEMFLGDSRDVPIPIEAMQRGARRVPEMDRVDDVPDRRRIERRARVGTRQSQREWRWLDQAMEEGDVASRGGGRRRGRGGRRRARAAVDDHRDHGDDDDHGDQHGGGHAGVGGVSPPHGSHGGEWYGSGVGDGSAQGDGGLGLGPLGDYFVGVPADDHTLHESQPWVSLGMLFSDLLASDGLDVDFGGSHFLNEISAIMQEDDAARRRGQLTGTQAPLDVDLNEPPSVPVHDYFALGGTPPSASHSFAGPSRAPVRGESVPSGSSSRPLPVQPRPPPQADPDDDDDDIEDEEPLVRKRPEDTGSPSLLHQFASI